MNSIALAAATSFAFAAGPLLASRRCERLRRRPRSRIRCESPRWVARSPATTVVLIGSVLALFNVIVIAFGIVLLTRSPDLGVAAWVVALTLLLTRRVDEEQPGMLPAARAL